LQHKSLTENTKYEEYTSTALIWINQTWYKLQSVRPAVESEKQDTRLRRWFDLSYLQSAVRSRIRPFCTLRFAVYPVSHANFASVFRKIPFCNFAFRISQITHSRSVGVCLKSEIHEIHKIQSVTKSSEIYKIHSLTYYEIHLHIAKNNQRTPRHSATMNGHWTGTNNN